MGASKDLLLALKCGPEPTRKASLPVNAHAFVIACLFERRVVLTLFRATLFFVFPLLEGVFFGFPFFRVLGQQRNALFLFSTCEVDADLRLLPCRGGDGCTLGLELVEDDLSLVKGLSPLLRLALADCNLGEKETAFVSATRTQCSFSPTDLSFSLIRREYVPLTRGMTLIEYTAEEPSEAMTTVGWHNLVDEIDCVVPI